ncbi:GNAT family N-acetyltransferase [Streptomyces sp. NPDC059740]|uniref:GNAT family N-acetyltransferase n=1 Tax=Streptomyces sp. NPDC059740 TaxID=3346926 RepID=UPI00365EBFC8
MTEEAAAQAADQADETDHRQRPARSAPDVRFVELSGEVMSALLKGDLAAAGGLAGVALTGDFLTERARWLWRYRLGQMAADPGRVRWMVRYALLDAEGLVVGHAGFHGPPDEAGTVEIGYFVSAAFRRRGHARAALVELLRRAAAGPEVTAVRATVSPDNAASLATLAGFGFAEVGEQWDEEDGRELVFEVPAGRSPASP